VKIFEFSFFPVRPQEFLLFLYIISEMILLDTGTFRCLRASSWFFLSLLLSQFD